MHTQNLSLLKAIAKQSKNPLVSMLADALIAHPAECNERLSILIHQTVASGGPVSSIMSILLDIDDALKEQGGEIPHATRLAPLAAELLAHAQASHLQDSEQQAAAESAPIFHVGRRTAAAVAGHITQKSAFARFTDRLLAFVLKHRIKKVHLQTAAPPDEEFKQAIQLLNDDLAAQGIRVDPILKVDGPS